MSYTGATNYISSIDVTYPLPGQDNNSQGFRSNFNNIYQALAAFDTYMGQLAATSLSVNAPYVTATIQLTSLGNLIVNISISLGGSTVAISTSQNSLSDTTAVITANNKAGNVATYANIVTGNFQSFQSGSTTIFFVSGVTGQVLSGATFKDAAYNVYTVSSVVNNGNGTFTVTANNPVTNSWSPSYPVVTFSNPTFGANVNNTVNTAINTAINNQLPVGTVIMWHGTRATVPDGWIICDGATYAINGVSYTGPNLTGAFAMGANSDSGQPNIYPTYVAVDTTGGTATIALLDHQHSYTDLGHDHQVGGAGNGLAQGANSGAWYNGQSFTSNTTTGIVIDGVINVAGGSQPVLSDNELVHNGNIPPYVALYYILKVVAYSYSGIN